MSRGDLDPGSEPSWFPDGEGSHDRTLIKTWLFRLRRERFRFRDDHLPVEVIQHRPARVLELSPPVSVCADVE